MKKILMGALAVVIAAAAVNATSAKTSPNALATFYYYVLDAAGNPVLTSRTDLPTATQNPFGCDQIPEEPCSRSYSEAQVDPSTKAPLNKDIFTNQILRAEL